MATLEQLEKAFIAADDAGNSEDAAAFAAEIRRMRATPQEKGILGKIRGAAEGIMEPALTVATSIPAMVAGNIAGVGSDIYSMATNQPKVGDKVAESFQSALTYVPRSEEGQKGITTVANLFKGEVGKLIQGLPIVGQELPALAEGIKLGSRTAKAATGMRAQAASENLMRSALKPTPGQYSSGAGDAAVSMLLERNLSPNKQGLAEIEARIAQLQDEIKSTIGGSQAVVSKQKVLDRLNEVRNRFLRTANPQEDLAAINLAGSKFGEHPLIPEETMPVQLAQDIKQGTYRELRGKYGELKSADVEAQKALARGLKEEISSAVPEVAALNKEESALLNTLDTVERRVFLEMNKDPVPMTGALRSPGAWAAFTADKSAAFKALVARWLYRQSKKLGAGIPAAQTPAKQGLTLAPLGEDIGRESPWMAKPPETRGLLGLVEDTQPTTSSLGMPNVDYPIEGRVGALYSVKPPSQPTVGLQLEPNLRMPVVNMSVENPAVQTRGMMSLAEDTRPIPDTQRLATRHDVPTVDFALRQEVLQNPEIVNSTQAFIAEAERLRDLISKAQGMWKGKYQAELTSLEKEFAAGMRQLGIDNPQDAIGIAKLYQGGGKTKLQIEKVKGLE